MSELEQFTWFIFAQDVEKSKVNEADELSKIRETKIADGDDDVNCSTEDETYATLEEEEVEEEEEGEDEMEERLVDNDDRSQIHREEVALSEETGSEFHVSASAFPFGVRGDKTVKV